MSQKSYIFRMEYEIDLNIELHFSEIDANMEIEVEEEILLQEK